MSPPHLSRLRMQKYCSITYNPNVFTTFLQLFFTLLDCQWFTNALFSLLLLSSPFFISPFEILNFQSPFSILKKPACFYHFTPAFQQKTPAFFLFIPTFPNQINGNRFQSSLDLLSIPVYPGWYSSIIYLLYHKRFFFIPFTHLFIHLIVSHFLWRVWRSAIILLQAHQKELLKMLFGF